MPIETKRNLALFNQEKINEIESWIRETIDSYLEMRKPHETAWQKYSRAMQCLYDQADHVVKTDSKLFDSETMDAVNTLYQRILIGLFTNDKIIECYCDDDEVDYETLKICEGIFYKFIKKQNLLKTFSPILRNGLQNGTFLSCIQNNHQEYNYLETKYKNKKPIKEEKTIISDIPKIEYVNIYDLIMDPTISDIDESDLIGRQMIIDANVLKDEKYFFNTRDAEKIQMCDPISNEKKEIYWNSGIDIENLDMTNKRVIIHCYFKYKIKENSDAYTPLYAVIDALDGHIMRIEHCIYDTTFHPFVVTQYIPRENFIYGIGPVEFGWPLQISLNNLINQTMDNIDINNGGVVLVPPTDRKALTPIKVDRYKMIPMQNPGGAVPLRVGSINEAYKLMDDLRQNIQKKLKASLVLQGQPLQGNRTATEAVGIREESNTGIKEILLNVSRNFMEPILNKYKNIICQFNTGEVSLKIPIDQSNTQFKVVKIDFDSIREDFKNNVKVRLISPEDQFVKQNNIIELKNLIQMAVQVPGVLNLQALLKKLLYDNLGFKDFAELMLVPQASNAPINPNQEEQILLSGAPINTNPADDNAKHLEIHTNGLMQLTQKVQSEEAQQIDKELISRVIMNYQNHIQEHKLRVQAMEINAQN